ncbi:MAG: era, partial [Francisellaceae bacterium]|nr:era [Francisellaceae bacterium]
MINPTQPDNNTHSGFVAIIGRPNVGKSTLLNKMISQKVSITSRKPQTTRQRIIGIKTQENTQIIYVDTPGIHQNAHKALNVYMNKEAKRSLREVDVILFVVENTVWTEEDEMVLNLIKKIEKPIILLINKIDKLEEKDWLLPHLELLSQKHNFLSIVPISARKNLNLTRLEKLIIQTMPEGPFYYEKEQVTDKTFKFRAA